MSPTSRGAVRWAKLKSLLRPARSLDAAYPEAARWAPELRARVLNAALGSLARRWVRGVTLLAIGLQLAVGFTLLIGTLINFFPRSHPLFLSPTLIGQIVSVAIGVLGLLLAGTAALLLHDQLIRWRLRKFSCARHACRICRYPLAGTFIVPPDLVRCPECGFPGRCSLQKNEIATDAQGRAVFAPAHGQPSLLQKIARSVWLRRAKKLAIRGAIIGAALLILTAISWEVFVRWQAQRAAQSRPPADALVPLAKKLQPPGTNENDPNAWDLFDDVQQQLSRLDDAEWSPASASRWPDFKSILDPNAGLHLYGPNGQRHKLAMRMLDLYERYGALKAMDTIADHPRMMREIVRGPNESIVSTPIPEHWQIRNMANICEARMQLASDYPNKNAFRASMRTLFALARLSESIPIFRTHRSGIEIRIMALARMKPAIIWHQDPAWLDLMEAELRHEDLTGARPTMLIAFDGSRIADTDLMCLIFENINNVRRLRFEDVSQLAVPIGKFWYGVPTLSHSRREIERFYAAAHARLALPTGQRDRAPALPVPNLEIGDSIARMTRAIEFMEDERAVETAGVVVMIALERLRLASGTYPDSLDDLRALPLDPFSGSSFNYRVSADRRSYTLWSTGPDKTDDGGTRSDDWKKSDIADRPPPGFDHVIFPPRSRSDGDS